MRRCTYPVVPPATHRTSPDCEAKAKRVLSLRQLKQFCFPFSHPLS
nr:MAG TPA: hypothetical protein [Caudoviricetes sp.]